jgi:hypothetical protein
MAAVRGATPSVERAIDSSQIREKWTHNLSPDPNTRYFGFHISL